MTNRDRNIVECKECGCSCRKCNSHHDRDVHLHIEIENLRQRLVERESRIATMETEMLNDASKFPRGETAALRDELQVWQDKYKRLYDAHRRIQRVNQGLEDKLLKLVDTCETEKGALTKDVATLSHKLADANYAIKKLTADNERYRDDVALAIQFLQCKQTHFVSQKMDSLPNEVQAKVSSYVASKRRPEEKKAQQPDVKSIKVPIPTFPPTAMVYSIPKSDTAIEEPESPDADIVSASIVAKILEERERERALAKHCDTCTCSTRNLRIIHDISTHTVGTQTQTGNRPNSLCLRCNSPALEHGTTPGSLKVVKNLTNVTQKSVKGCAIDCDPKIAKVEPNNYLKENSSSSGTASCASDVSNKSSGLLANHCDDSSSTKRSSGGPRYCSVRVQTGSKNILLDNIHDGITPVLYTHPDDRKSRQHRSLASLHKTSSIGLVTSEQSTSSPQPTAETTSPDSLKQQQQRHQLGQRQTQHQHQQQRVAEWIQSNCDSGNYETSPHSSRQIPPIPIDKTPRLDSIDPIRYAEMENNVKRFLLGESEFLKKVAIGKQNYQNLRDGGGGAGSDQNQTLPRTETEI